MWQKYWLTVLFTCATLAVAQMPGSPGGAPGSGFPQQQTPGMPGANNGPMQPMEHHVDEGRFIRDAAAGSLAGVELGKLAAQKGSSEAVRQFGQKLADQQSKMNEELKAVAGQASVKVPDTVDSRRRSRIDKLSKLSGAAFDKEYAKEQVKDQQQGVDAFQDEAEYGRTQGLKDFANKNLPDLRQSLDTAKALKKETETRD